jgi:hypothetical protein
MQATLIKSSETVLSKMVSGAELCRGCQSGWYLYRGTVRLGRVASAAAVKVIDSGRVARVDDRRSVVGETYAILPASEKNDGEWVDRAGTIMTGTAVSMILNRAAGLPYDAKSLAAAHRVGSIYQNGGLWFQRIA